jgi:hypothetical protein
MRAIPAIRAPVCAFAGERLRGAKSAHEAAVDRLLQNTFKAAREGDGAIGVKGVSSAITTRNGENYVAHVLALTSGAWWRAVKVYAASAAPLHRQNRTGDNTFACGADRAAL